MLGKCLFWLLFGAASALSPWDSVSTGVKLIATEYWRQSSPYFFTTVRPAHETIWNPTLCLEIATVCQGCDECGKCAFIPQGGAPRNDHWGVKVIRYWRCLLHGRMPCSDFGRLMLISSRKKVPKMGIPKMGHRAKLRCHTPCYHALMPPEMWPAGAPVYPGCLREMFESLLFFVQFQLKVVYPKGWGSYENWWRWSPWSYLWVTSIAPPSRVFWIWKVRFKTLAMLPMLPWVTSKIHLGIKDGHKVQSHSHW